MRYFLKTTILICFLFAYSLCSAQRIEKWSTYNVNHIIPYQSFLVIGFNYSELPNEGIERRLQTEIRKNFNTVDTIYLFSPDSVNLYQYNYWVDPIRKTGSDGTLAYSITPFFSKRKKKSAYKPILQETYKNSFGSYLLHHAKNTHKKKKYYPEYVIEINIFEENTLNLVWSGRTLPIPAEQLSKTYDRAIEKLIRSAIQSRIINEERKK